MLHPIQNYLKYINYQIYSIYNIKIINNEFIMYENIKNQKISATFFPFFFIIILAF